MNAERPSFFQRFLRLVAWDVLIVPRVPPEGFVSWKQYLKYDGKCFLNGLIRVAVILIVWAVVLMVLPESLVPVFVTLFTLWEALRFLVAFLVSRGRARMNLPRPKSAWARILTSNAPVSVLFIWLFLVNLVHGLYLAATPFRPLEYDPAPKDRIASWLLDENGNLPERTFFEVGDASCLPYDEEGWTNLLARVGNPPPPEIRYLWLATRPDPFLESDAQKRIASLVDQKHTNLVLRMSLSEEDRAALDDWLDSYDGRIEQLAECSGRQAIHFITNHFALVNQFAVTRLPPYNRNVVHSQNVLLFEADGGTSVSFLDALRKCNAEVPVLLEKDESLVSASVVRLLLGIQCDNIIRFSERAELSTRDFNQVREAIRKKEPPRYARDMATHIVWESRNVPSECFQRGGRALFPLDLQGFKARKVEAAFFCLGYDDCQGADAGMREHQEWAAVRVSTMLDPEFHDPKPLDGRVKPIRWIRGWWTRGGLVRLVPSKSFFPIFDRHLIQSIFADAYPAVEDAALLLAQFRAEEGRDAESLEEAATKIGGDVLDSGSAFVELRYERIAPPEGAVEGASAYALALVPKKTAPEWFRSEDRIAAWIVVRNPSFPGTRPSRLYVLDLPTGSDPSPDKETLAAAEGAPGAESARLVIPAALFGSDAEAIAAAERTMEENGWRLR